MNEEIRNLEPKAIWNNFADLNAVPRPSKKEDRVIAFMQAFGEKLNLSTQVDQIGNVVIKKPATPGYEDRQTIVLQSHLDMVHQKNNDTEFDFDTQGIEMYVEGDWVKAKGTTLGADNGLGVATIMAILESDTIEHPAIEALFTIDEETGMTGAKELDDSILEGTILLNLDTEEDDEIGIGCAGGIDLTATRNYDQENSPADSTTLKIIVNGLNGGHSGMDIIKGLGNANKLMNRILLATQENGLRVAEIQGGGLRNAIPRESVAKVVVANNQLDAFKASFNAMAQDIKSEYQGLEEELNIQFEAIDSIKEVMAVADQKLVLNSLAAAHNGVFRMSPAVEGLVETSNNIAKVSLEADEIKILCLTRSSVESSKHNLVSSLKASFELGGFQVELSGDYPGWAPNPNSQMVKNLAELYVKQNGEEANVAACHAGLECGIIGSHYPKMDMVSFGPTIRGAHSPDERASISSTQKFWKFLLAALKEIPKK